MSNHLSQDQFETCVFGRAGQSELQHIGECPECCAEVDRFSKGLALFRRAVRDLANLAAEPAGLDEKADFTTSSRASPGTPMWRWALAAATLSAAIALSFFIPRPKPIPDAPAEISPEAVMERMNRHLAGTVPEAMEPAMSLISGEQPGNEPKGAEK